MISTKLTFEQAMDEAHTVVLENKMKTTNAHIRTSTGISIIANGKPYVVESTHINYDKIVDAVMKGQYSRVKDLIDVVEVVKQYFHTADTLQAGDVKVNTATNTITFRGTEIKPVFSSRIFDMIAQNYSPKPIIAFLNNLMHNPSKKAIDELENWVERNGITITEDGYLLAHKRVQDNYKSFYDGKTDNSIGSIPEMPRWQVDDRSENTCSSGLHFCSLNYLPHYHGGKGRALILKINPTDVVSIPTDYNHAKGRACRYEIVGELTGDAREDAEVEGRKVLTQPVLADVDVVNHTNEYKRGYVVGYKAGRGKQKNEYKLGASDTEFGQGYGRGYYDGRHRHPQLFA